MTDKLNWYVGNVIEFGNGESYGLAMIVKIASKEWNTMNENKCIYCDFNHPDHIGAEIYNGEYIPEEVMYDSEWSDEFEYAYLKQKNGYFVLATLHNDNEFYSWDGDETGILYCPMCGRKLSND